MADEITVKATRTVPHIPIEVSAKIAAAISDVESARALSRTCSALRDAGELKCWEMVDITSGWDVPSDNLTVEEYRARATTVDKKLAHVIAAIKAYPTRAEGIRGIRLEPSNGIDGHRARALIDFLKPYSPRLTYLAVLPLPVNPAWSPDQRAELGCDTLYSTLNSDLIPLPKITRLQYASGQSVRGPIPEWILRIGTLKDLECSNEEVSFEDTVKYIKEYSRETVMSNLSSVTVNHVPTAKLDTTHSKLLASLLTIAPQLFLLYVTGHWSSRDDNLPLRPSGRAKRTKSSMIFRLNRNFSEEEGEEEEGEEDSDGSEGGSKPFDPQSAITGTIMQTETAVSPGGSEASGSEHSEGEASDREKLSRALEDLEDEDDYDGSDGYDDYPDSDDHDPTKLNLGFGIGVSPSHSQYGVLELKTWDCKLGLDRQDIDLPKDNTVARISLLPVPHPSLLEPICLPINPAKYETEHIPSSFIRQLRRTPDLTSICLPYAKEPFPVDYNTEDSEFKSWNESLDFRWVENGHRGAIIRQYVKYGTVMDTGDEFWHISILSKDPQSEQRIWRELTRYKGKTVPRKVLEEVYKTAPLDFGNRRGGRKLKLGRAGWRETNPAWHVLYTWRKDAGDRSDEEDLLSNASDEDEANLWSKSAGGKVNEGK